MDEKDGRDRGDLEGSEKQEKGRGAIKKKGWRRVKTGWGIIDAPEGTVSS
jgi:hypothetical protein